MALFFFDRLQMSALLGNILAVFAGVAFAGVFLINQMPGAKPEEALLLGISSTRWSAFRLSRRISRSIPSPGCLSCCLACSNWALPYVLFSIGIKRTPPVQASLIATLEPLLNPMWVLLFMGERRVCSRSSAG